MANKTYKSSIGEDIDVQSINAFQLVNALLKNAQFAVGELATPLPSENLAVLKEEVLRRLTLKPE